MLDLNYKEIYLPFLKNWKMEKIIKNKKPPKNWFLKYNKLMFPMKL